MRKDIRLFDIDLKESLRTRNGSEYFDFKTVPRIGEKVVYYKFNSDELFEGKSIAYIVVDVLNELQESYNGLFEERVTVELKKIG